MNRNRLRLEHAKQLDKKGRISRYVLLEVIDWLETGKWQERKKENE